MAATLLTYADVAAHNSKKDLYVVIHDSVYNASSFVDEHPGGEEVLLDLAGQDATEAFEDVGHSDEAREILAGLKVATLKRQPGDPKPKSMNAAAPRTPGRQRDSTAIGVGLYAAMVLGGGLAYLGYAYLHAKEAKNQA